MSAIDQDDVVRAEIGALLRGGLKTEVWPRTETSQEVNALVQRLRTDAADLRDKLIAAGFTDHVVTVDGLEQPCETCMYFVVSRRFCELPELMVPVEPDWSCRLWRI